MTPVEINYQLLVRLSRCTYSKDDVTAAVKLLSHPDFDKELFVASCFKQKVAGLVYLNLNRWGISRMLPWMGLSLRFFFLGNVQRNKKIQVELQKIVRRARALNLDIRPLKGGVLVPLIYSDGGSRLLIDIDFFVKRTDLSKVTEVLRRLGYKQGTLDKETNTISPLSREKKLLWQLKMFETPPFLKPVNDEYLNYGNVFTIDVSFGLSFSDRGDVSTTVLLQSAEIAGYRTLSVIDFFIQLCAHLYKEASNESWVEIDLDINLIKFCDVREFVLRMFNRRNFRQIRARVEELGAQQAVYFSLRSAHEIYSDGLVADLINALDLNFDNYDFMTSIYRQNRKVVSVRHKSLVQAIGGSSQLENLAR